MKLYLAYDALSTYKNISVPNEALTGYTTMSAFEVVHEFFNNLFASYDANKANGDNLFGYLCTEHEEHFKLSFRALYLYKMLEVNNIEFTLADDMLDAAAELESSGKMKYTNMSETKNVICDFEYLWYMSAQIKRIRDTKLKSLDAELVEAINTYMYDTKKVYNDIQRCAGAFYSLALSDDFRNNNGKISTVTGWGLYFGLNAADDNWGELIDLVNKIIARFYEDTVFVKTSKAGLPYTMLINQEVTEHAFVVSSEAEAVIEAFHGLSELGSKSAVKGWNGSEAGYIAYELEIFRGLLEKYNELVDEQDIILEECDTNKWNLWKKLSDQWTEIEKETDPITVWDIDFTGEEASSSKTLPELIAMFVDGAFWYNATGHGKSCTASAQLYLCVEEAASSKNTMYTLYLHQLALVAQEFELDYYDAVWNMIKNDGGNIVIDFDYMVNMSKVAVKVINGEITFLNAELATAINTYMVADQTVAGGRPFHNGTWEFSYRNNWYKGGFKRFAENGDWIKLLGTKANELMRKPGDGGAEITTNFFWYPLINPVIELIKKAGEGDKLIATTPASNSFKENCVPVWVSAPVTALERDPDALDTVEAIKAYYDKLHDLDDVTPAAEATDTAPAVNATWLGGASATFATGEYQYHYIFDEAMMFDKVQTAAAEISQVDAVKAAIGAEDYERWAEVVADYKVLAENENKYPIVNNLQNGATYEASALDLVRAFFNGVFGSWEGTENSSGTSSSSSVTDPAQKYAAPYGYLCLEDQAHFLQTIRALYLRKLISENNLKFDLVDDMLDTIAEYGNGHEGKELNSRYTDKTEAQNAIDDFDYLWNMAKQIKRIQDGECNSLDAQLVAAINANMYVAAGDKHCANSFYSTALSYRYRNGGVLGFGSGWERYLGLTPGEGVTWGSLIKNVTDIIEAAYPNTKADVLMYADGNAVAMLVKAEVVVGGESAGSQE